MKNVEIAVGILAIAGSATVGISDMVLSGMPISGAEHAALGLRTAQGKSALALQLSGFAGVANLLVALGVWQWYRLLLPAGRTWAILTCLPLATFFLLGVTVHFVWPIMAIVLLSVPSDPTAVAASLYDRLFGEYFLPLGLMGFGLFILGSILFAATVLTGRTRLPRWFAWIAPAFPVVALYVASPQLPAPFGGYIRSNFLHLVLPLLFGLSTAVVVREGRNTDEPG